jgi:hypothetical protein
MPELIHLCLSVMTTSIYTVYAWLTKLRDQSECKLYINKSHIQVYYVRA